MTVKLNFIQNKNILKSLPEEDYEAIERAQDGEVRLYLLRPLIAKFLCDDQGKMLPLAIAKKMLGKIPVGEWDEVIRQFIEMFKDAAVPNMNGDSLTPLSDQAQASESLVGSQP